METHLDATRIAGPDACRRILLVGEDNPLSTSPEFALYFQPSGCSGHRLQSKILGLDARRHYLAMWRSNLCCGGWDRSMAKDRAAALCGQRSPWDTIVLLGVKVAGAFAEVLHNREVAQMFEVTRYSGDRLAISVGIRGGDPGDTSFVTLPHPSGRNTLWNDKAQIARARHLLWTVAPDVPWGELDRQHAGATP